MTEETMCLSFEPFRCIPHPCHKDKPTFLPTHLDHLSMKIQNSRHLTFALAVVMVSCQPQVTETQQSDMDFYENAITMCFIPAGMKWDFSQEKAPLLEGMDLLNFPVSTENDLARRYFNQGLLLAYAFNHAEAERSFQYAYSLDPEFAMAHWGHAYVLGPNYNAGMEPDHYKVAYEAIQKAKSLLTKTNAREAALIRAMEKRYVEEPLTDRYPLDLAYAEALEEAYGKFPDDPDIGVLYAEAMMDLQPWDLWDKDGNPKGEADKIVSTLEKIMDIHPNHPGAHHLYIHAVEGSKNPDRGLRSAQLFDDGLALMAGHLVHMSSHIYIRTGHYNKGTLANLRAAKVDSLYIQTCEAQGTYPLAYFPHNYHFMAGTAILEGSSKWAAFAADRLYDHTQKDLMTEEGLEVLQHFYTIPYFVKVKFGKWDEILEMDPMDTKLEYPLAIQHYARGMAYLGKDRPGAAGKELLALKKYAAMEKFENAKIWDINSLKSMLEIAERVLEGEWLASQNQYDKAISVLQEAADIEDQLGYNEPPDWFLSVKHHLGAVLIEAGRYEEAVNVFEKDLEEFPNNGWALHGLKKAYSENGNRMALAQTEELLGSAWKTADITLATSRIK